MERSVWEEIQKAEFLYHVQKDKSRILEINKKYWESLLLHVEPHVTAITEDSRVLDVGCGCCGILLAMDRGKRVGMDPLMDEYLKEFEYLRKADVTWICGTAEDCEFENQFDVIFVINSLDHMYDPGKAAKKLDTLLKPGGHMIVLLNCHNTDFFRWYYQTFYKVIDAHHPYHFRPHELPGLFPGYVTTLMEDIDWIYLQHRREYREEVLQKKGPDWKKIAGILCNPFKYPMILARILTGKRVHRTRNEQSSIFSIYLFILQKQ